MEKKPEKIEDISIELIDRQDIQSLLAKLAEHTGCSVAYRDIINVRTYAHSEDYCFMEMVKTYPVSELQRLFSCYWLIEAKVRCGFLVLGKKEPDTAIVNAALIGIRILIRRELQEQLRRRKYASNLIWDILRGRIADEDSIMESLRSIGIRKDYPCMLFILEAEDRSEENAFDEKNVLRLGDVEKQMSAFFVHAFLIRKKGAVWCVLTLDEIKHHDARRLKEQVGKAAATLTEAVFARRAKCRRYIGVSGSRPTLTKLAECAGEASRSAAYARIHDLSDEPAYWDDIGCFKMLFSISATEEAKQVYSRILGKLVAYDSRHNGGLVMTLEELVRNNWNIRQTAQKMAFHQNTIKYRYAKISELTDGDISNGAFRFELAFALKLHWIYTCGAREVHED